MRQCIVQNLALPQACQYKHSQNIFLAKGPRQQIRLRVRGGITIRLSPCNRPANLIKCCSQPREHPLSHCMQIKLRGREGVSKLLLIC